MMKVVWMVVWTAWAWWGVATAATEGYWWLSTTSLPPSSSSPSPVASQGEEYCECVPYYLCVNGVISTSGEGVIDIRLGNRPKKPTPVTNVKTCPVAFHVCCKVPTTTTTPPPTTSLRPTLPPDTPCDCVPFLECTEERLVSDGKGNTSLSFYGVSYSHSKCPQTFAVCCVSEVTPLMPSAKEECECVEEYLCNANGTLITDGAGLINIRSGIQRYSNGSCPPHYACCQVPSKVTTPKPTSISPFVPIMANAKNDCECVEPHLCDANGNIITDGAGVINIRVRNTKKSNDSCPIPLICCRPPSNAITSTTTTTTTTTTPAVTYRCGTRHRMGVQVRILGFEEEGGESQFGEFPWVAAVISQELVMGVPIRRFVGGGTIIHPRVILTAAHKVSGERKQGLVVRVGEWDTQEKMEPLPHQDVEVEDVIFHPAFDPARLWHDVALLILKEEVQLASHVNTICLATDLSRLNTTACVVNGWGLNGFEKTSEYQKVMKSLTLPMVDVYQCQNSLRTTRLGRYFRLHPSFNCAGGEKGKDTCRGDGGGPLACPLQDEPNQYLLVGLTAWGIGCGMEGIPGVYVNVPFHHQWITSTILARLPSTTTSTSTTPFYA